MSIILTLEGQEIILLRLPEGYYLYRLDNQEQCVGRIPKSQVQEIMKRAREKVDLITCNMPYANLYSKLNSEVEIK